MTETSYIQKRKAFCVEQKQHNADIDDTQLISHVTPMLNESGVGHVVVFTAERWQVSLDKVDTWLPLKSAK